MKQTHSLADMPLILAQVFLVAFLLFTLAYAVLVLIELVRVARGDVPYVPSTGAAIRAAIGADVLPKEGMILDLGAGDGRALRMLAKAGYQGPLIGYERAAYPWIIGRVLSCIQRQPITLYRRDFKHAPLEEAKGIYVFLLRETLAALAPELKRRCAPGTIIISAEFPIANWTPTQTLRAKGVTAKDVGVFVYQI